MVNKLVMEVIYNAAMRQERTRRKIWVEVEASVGRAMHTITCRTAMYRQQRMATGTTYRAAINAYRLVEVWMTPSTMEQG